MPNKSFGGKRKQLVKVLTEDNGAVEAELNVERRYATLPKSFEAWGINRIQQVKDKETNEFIQFISEISYVPLTLWPSKDAVKDAGKSVKANIDAIASEAVDDELAFIDERKHKHKALVYLGIIAVTLGLTIAIIIFMTVSKGGGIKF